MDPRVFISYRGEDSHSYGALLHAELTRHFGKDLVFLDAESIPAGADFVEALLDRVRSARVLLAVIGPRWLTATDATGWRRIDHPADWIRRELAEAFAARIRVIPVLTDDAEIPREAELPPDIAALARLQYRRLHRRNATVDLDRIVADLASLDPILASVARNRDDTPRELPAAPGLFTGRGSELTALTDVAATAPDLPATVPILAISGPGGIGKTALALHWAYQHLGQFPDGQMYVDLRGSDRPERPTPARVAVRVFLSSLGVDPSTLPVELDAEVVRYRSRLAGKRMLIMLDNAADVEQVVPLLPGSPTCTVVVTSRSRLTGLAARHGAYLLGLGALPEPDARKLLGRYLGPDRLAAEPAAVDEMLVVCAGLPLAVRTAAALAQGHPSIPLSVLVKGLADGSVPMDGSAPDGLRRKRVFVSYVRADSEAVDRLVVDLRTAGYDVWLDRTHLLPGMRWRSVIKQAIEQGDYFLACFSPRYWNGTTYMNEELNLAVERLRLMPRDRNWFIPVMLETCELPDHTIGPGETLADSIQYADFTSNWAEALRRLMTALGMP